MRADVALQHRLALEDFDALADLWKSVETSDPRMVAGRVAEDLDAQLDLPMAMFEGEQSKFFKHHYRNTHRNMGIMTREIDVIRKQEGW